MLALVVAVVASQSPVATAEVALLPVIRDDSLPVLAVDARLRQMLSEEGVSSQSADTTAQLLAGQSPATCQTNPTCYGLLGRSLSVPLVIRIEASAVESDLAVFAQAITTDTLQVVAEASFVTDAKSQTDKLRPGLEPVVRAIAARLPKRASPATAEKTEAAAQPGSGTAVAKVDAVTTAPPPSRGPRILPFVSIGAGVLAGAAGVLLLNDADAMHAELVDDTPERFTPDEGAAMRDRGARNQTLGWAAIGVGGALATAGAVLFLMPEADTTSVSLNLAPGGGAVTVMGAF